MGHRAVGRRELPKADLALAGVLAVFAGLDVVLSPEWRGPVAINVVMAPAMALSLAWRRTQPLIALSAVTGGVVFLSLAFGSTQSWTNVFLTVVAVYSAVAHGSKPLAVVAITAIGVAVATVQDPLIHTFGDAVWSSSLAGLTFLAGLAGRGLRVRAGALDHRAEALDAEEEQRAAAAVAEERQRIARELHDIISHSLGVVVLQAGAAEQVLQRDPERAREVLQFIRATGQEAIGEMGTLLGLIRVEHETSREPQPSLADLDRLVAKMKQAGLDVEVEVEGERRALPTALELSAYRVVQEGLTNIVKHATGARGRVLLRFGAEELHVEVVDDGSGLSSGPGSRRGLAGMCERVAVFGGAFEAGPHAGGGWKLRATFPVAR